MLRRRLAETPRLSSYTFFTRQLQQTYQRLHHHSSQNNSHVSKTYFPIFTFLEIGVYVGTLFYLGYSIKNEKVKLNNSQTSNLNEAPKEIQESKGPKV